MKSAAIVYEFPSLSQTFVRNQIEGLIDAGCDVQIFADNSGFDAQSHFERTDGSLLDRVTYFGLPLKNLRESVGRWRSRFRAPAARTLAEPGRSSQSQAGGAALRLRIEARAFRNENRFDVIHAHFGPNGVRAVRLRAIGVVSGPVLTSFYGYDVGRHWTREGYDRLFAEGDRFIALSEHMRERLVAMGCPADRLIIHRLGVDLDRFALTSRVENSQLEVISIARLVPKKGIEYGLRAMAELMRRKIPVRYTVVGYGELRQPLEQIAGELGIGAIVRFAGAQSQDEIAGMLQKSDVLLAPSVTAADGDAEGTPVAILEAQASGLPVVSTRHAGIPEIVDDGRSGFLVPEGSVQDLAESLARLSESPSLRQSMGNAGRAIVTERHDISKLNRELIRIYEGLVT